jgi:hypothetical protein
MDAIESALLAFRSGDYDESIRIAKRVVEQNGSPQDGVFGAIRPAEDFEVLANMTPRFLAGAPEQTIANLRYATARVFLFGWPKQPDDAVRLFVSAAQSRMAYESAVRVQSSSIAVTATISCSGEEFPPPCPNCRALLGQRWSLKDCPEIPHISCTNKVCRCCYNFHYEPNP